MVVLDWSDKRNALGPAESRELTDAITAAVTSDVCGLVLTGNGAFCAGGNLRGAVERSDAPQQPRLRDARGEGARVTTHLGHR
jgi:enoyl-CoA hydratase